MKPLFSSIIAALAVLSMVACGPKDDPVIAVTGITLSQTSVSLEVGGKVSLTATVSPSDATDKTVTWTSSNSSVASVSGGVVTAAAEDLTLNPGETFLLEATVSPSDATDKTVTWTSSDPSVVSVENGLVKAVSAGTAHGDDYGICRRQERQVPSQCPAQGSGCDRNKPEQDGPDAESRRNVPARGHGLPFRCNGQDRHVDQQRPFSRVSRERSGEGCEPRVCHRHGHGRRQERQVRGYSPDPELERGIWL